MDENVTEIDITKLRYALYARKSTDDMQRQVRSIGDQITECEDLATRMGLRLVRPYIKETKSAKKPGQRPLFSKLLADLRQGKIDGILAWHPDRLARNMKEGGELIDLIDEKVVKDLKFVTHHFTNDANGKMLLGMAFVLSKHYSDDLSQKVTRGMRQGFKEGKSSGSPKHGYVRTEDGIYKPDSNNFALICEAWQMRKEGMGMRDIADYMNSKGYARIIKDRGSKNYGKKIPMSHQILSERVFNNPFYYGMLIQANNQVDLRTIYDFEPAVSEEDYNEVQRLSRARLSPFIRKRRDTFFPLHSGMVRCAICNHSMTPGASKGRDKKYLYYRCTNKNCERKKKGIRANIVFNYIYELLKDGVELGEKDYEYYHEHLTALSGKQHVSLRTELNNKQAALKATNRQRKEIGLAIVKYDKNSTVWKFNDIELTRLDKDAEDLTSQIDELNKLITDPEQELLSIEQFLNLAKNAGSKVKAANEVGKDHICRIIFLNLVVDEQKVVDYHLTKAFSKLEKMQVCPSWSG